MRSEKVTAESADVLIITPEKFMALAQNHSGLENIFGTIICDEGHLIDDTSRGLQYELLLTKLKGSDERTKNYFHFGNFAKRRQHTSMAWGNTGTSIQI